MQNAYIHQLAHNCVSVVLSAEQAVSTMGAVTMNLNSKV